MDFENLQRQNCPVGQPGKIHARSGSGLMSITSHSFLLLFIPLVVTGYYLLTKTPRQKTFVLLGVSYLFYALAGPKFIPVLFGLSIATFFIGKWDKFGWGVILNLAALVLFKYWNFGIENANLVLSALKIGYSLGLLKLGLPLGLSFFVFKHIGYLLDLQQKRYPPAADFWTFAAFSAYFPQISAGPISSFKDTASQFTKLPERLSGEQLKSSLVYISLGLAKKLLLADTIGSVLGPPINRVGGFSGLIPAWYLVIAYAAQLYFDFSGYTDITLGISGLFGIRLPQNFNNPYLASNPGEFWERWHMSLSMWFRTYLFSPLSRSFLRKWGSDKREWAQYAANLVTMGLVGLWHGAGWSYILWGLYHGVYLNFGAWWKRANRKIPAALEKGIFLFGILLGWALFMSPNTPYLIHLYQQMFGFGGLGSLELITKLLQNNATLALIFAIPLAFSGYAEAANFENKVKVNNFVLAGLGLVAAISILMLEGTKSFIYIGF
jgi:alginate O-acetyltransferase complex protein AlgI